MWPLFITVFITLFILLVSCAPVNNITNEELNNILLKHIPDDKKNIGFWRNYAVFGLDEKIFRDHGFGFTIL